MSRRHRLLIAAVLVGGLVTPALAQSAKTQYEEALRRELLLRDSSSTPAVRPTRIVVRGLENVARQHPTSGYSDDALWHAGILAADLYDWHHVRVDAQTAERLLRWLVREYPHSKHNRAAVARLENLLAPPPVSASTPAATPPAAPSQAAETPPTSAAGGGATSDTQAQPQSRSALKAVSRTVTSEVERVAIELDAEVAYQKESLDAPPRIFFDLQQTSVSRDLLKKVQEFDSHVVRQIRLGRHPNGVTRVVLNLQTETQHSVFALYNPYRIVVEFPIEAPAPATTRQDSTDEPAVAPSAVRAAATGRPPSVDATHAGPSVDPTRNAITVPDDAPTASAVPPTEPPSVRRQTLPKTPLPLSPAQIGRDIVPADPPLATPPPEPAVVLGMSELAAASPAALDDTITASSSVPFSAPPPAPVKPTPSDADAAAAATSPEPAPRSPATNISGGFSLARQLGLGISRIVLDPGHGGHDPGALGKGISEAATTLDITLRLEKLLLEDGTFDVLLTRRTDVYVPLEERTAIANRADADLFLSIHLNSSRNKAARGFETYYLNFASDPAAEAVAARENSASGRTMRNLPTIVEAIALNNKLDESKDLASLVQRSLSRRIRANDKNARDLGVKRAPFVVLIGASMPSVLAEVSFISHAQEANLLKTPAYRQRIAQALYDSIVQYRAALKATMSVAQQ